jgi:hypothetical protein
MTTTELAKWVETAEIDGADVPVPPNLIRGLLAKSVIDNWPRYEIAEDGDGQPVALRFGSPAAANKALEMLAKDAGMLADSVKVSGGIEIRINGVNLDDLS